MAEATNPAGEIDFGSLAGLSQEEVNKRLLAAMLMQGSAKYDQAMLADTLGRSRGPVPLGPRGRGTVGELNDFATAFRPGMERSQAQEMVKQLRAKDLATMQAILGGGKAQAGQNRAEMLAPGGAPPPSVDPSAGLLRQPRAQPDMPGAPAIGMRASADPLAALLRRGGGGMPTPYNPDDDIYRDFPG